MRMKKRPEMYEYLEAFADRLEAGDFTIKEWKNCEAVLARITNFDIDKL